MMINSLFLGHGIILSLHTIPNRKQDKASFQVTYNMVVYTVGILNSSNNKSFFFFFLIWLLNYMIYSETALDVSCFTENETTSE